MTASHISGPSIVFGNPSAKQENPDAGPSIAYQGWSILDPRLPYNPGQSGRGTVRAFADAPFIVSVDAVPSAFSPTMIAAAQTATSGTPLVLATTNTAGRGVNFPIFPTGVSPLPANLVYTLALDPAFTTVATTAGSNIVTTTAGNMALNARFVPGMAVLIGSAASTWTLARIGAMTASTLSLVDATGVPVPMPATNATAQVATSTGQGRLDNPQLSYTPAVTAGAARVFDGRGGVSRGVSVTSNNAADTGWTVLVRGFDRFLAPMSELIPVTANGVAYGNKCFGFILSATPAKGGGGASTGTLSVGTSDLIGFHTRVDAWGYTNTTWAGALVTASTGFVAADTTSPATTTTKDVRGAMQLSANGPNAGYVGANATDGTRRLTMSAFVPIDNLAFATTANPAPLFGVTQA